MSSKKKSAVFAAALATAFASGAVAERLVAPPSAFEAKVVKLRIDDAGLAIVAHVKIGSAVLGREITCNLDGSKPSLKGKPVAEEAAAKACKAAATFAKDAQGAVGELSSMLGNP